MSTELRNQDTNGSRPQSTGKKPGMPNNRIEMSRTLCQKRIDSSLRGCVPCPVSVAHSDARFHLVPQSDIAAFCARRGRNLLLLLQALFVSSSPSSMVSPFLPLPGVPQSNLTCPDHATLGSAPVKRHYLGKLEASLSPVSLIGPCALAIWTRRQ